MSNTENADAESGGGVPQQYGKPDDEFRLTAFARKNAHLPDGGL